MISNVQTAGDHFKRLKRWTCQIQNASLLEQFFDLKI